MRAALVVSRATADRKRTWAGIRRQAILAAESGAELVLFPEAALTGLINDDRPRHDLPLGVEADGHELVLLSRLARRCRVYLGIGLLEREERRLYDSAFLLNPEGKIILKYRRMSRGWHGRKASPAVYRQGTCLTKVETPLGSFAFLICGDLFSNRLTRMAREIKPDWLLFPFARPFADGAYDQKRWDRREMAVYARRSARTGATTLLVNSPADKAIDGGTFGGAWVVRPDGTVSHSLPLGKPRMLVVDL
jgi:predicted amidohydrolase